MANNKNNKAIMKTKFLEEAECCRLSIPLILRLFEFIREDTTSDEDLHFMAERISEMCEGGAHGYQQFIESRENLQQLFKSILNRYTHSE